MYCILPQLPIQYLYLKDKSIELQGKKFKTPLLQSQFKTRTICKFTLVLHKEIEFVGLDAATYKSHFASEVFTSGHLDVCERFAF